MPLTQLFRFLGGVVLILSAFGPLARAQTAAPPKLPNPLILQRADPFILHYSDGYYYFMGTVPEYDRLELRRAKTIAGLAAAEPKAEPADVALLREIRDELRARRP